MSKTSSPIRVLIAEDSLVCRELLVSILQSAPGIQVVGTARDGVEAVRLTRRLKPDLITMDITMPQMDGFEATRQIMAEMPCPIVMITHNENKNDRDHTFDALQAGALIVLQKPTINDSEEVFAALVSQIKLMADVKVVRRWSTKRDDGGRKTAVVKPLPIRQGWVRKGKTQLVAIAASTGGPGALTAVLRPLPADFPLPILVVQHVTQGFGDTFATWLDKQTSLSVRIGRHSDEPKAGEVLVAPDNYHMGVNNMGLITLQKKSPNESICPSADHLFGTVAGVYGATAVGVVLTGMGRDGADGLQVLRELGAHTIAQDEETCVVFGMPAAAIQQGAIEQVQPLSQIASAILRLI